MKKKPLKVTGLIKLVHWFEGIGTLEDYVRAGRPYLSKERATRVAAEIEALAYDTNIVHGPAVLVKLLYEGNPQSSNRLIIKQ